MNEKSCSCLPCHSGNSRGFRSSALWNLEKTTKKTHPGYMILIEYSITQVLRGRLSLKVIWWQSWKLNLSFLTVRPCPLRGITWCWVHSWCMKVCGPCLHFTRALPSMRGGFCLTSPNCHPLPLAPRSWLFSPFILPKLQLPGCWRSEQKW